MMPAAAMIFAAGLGTRMGALTVDRPKPLLQVAGRPLIDHALALVRNAGIQRVVVNTHAHADQMRAYIVQAAPDVAVSHEVERLETGGGLLQALPLLGPGPVFTLNADMVWAGPNPLTALAAAWDAARMGGLLCLLPREVARGHTGPGDFDMDANGRLTRRGVSGRAEYVYTGAQIIDPSVLCGSQGAFSLNPVWDALIATGRLYGTVHTGSWVDVGRPEGLALAEAELAG